MRAMLCVTENDVPYLDQMILIKLKEINPKASLDVEIYSENSEILFKLYLVWAQVPEIEIVLLPKIKGVVRAIINGDAP